jgi:hypothetical protein
VWGENRRVGGVPGRPLLNGAYAASSMAHSRAHNGMVTWSYEFLASVVRQWLNQVIIPFQDFRKL